ncbi:hypothetical protein KIN20_008822 [Parelaphostrongylus tenuis]|uniref:Uncharacterized protein n=1 Tax=Parelaphostrongylus tenuis TaxID=148309 RepID=A0AAD5QKT8_PARTN|nr:hypothetical protein KIN20_008822 [Parelaphostrongylus tenuis]
MAMAKSGIDPILKTFYRNLKLEMESLRQERNNLRTERDTLLDENANLTVRAKNAEKLVEFANDDIECLKRQLSLIKDKNRKNDAVEVAELVNGGGGSSGMMVSSALPGVEFKTAPAEEHTVPTFHENAAKKIRVTTEVEPSTSLFHNEGHDLSTSLDVVEKSRSEVHSQKVRLFDSHRDIEKDTPRRDSVSASELRRIARRQARRAQSKVFSAEPFLRFVAKPSSALEKSHDEVKKSHEATASTTSEMEDCVSSCKMPPYVNNSEVDHNPLSSKSYANELEARSVSHHSTMDSTRDFSRNDSE